jgi:hypothetical protein
MRTIAVIIVGLVLVGCAEGAAQTQTITEFERAGTNAIANSQWGRLYDSMHPAQQRFVPYKRFFNCMAGNSFLAKGFGVNLATIKFINARVVKQKSMTIPETKIRVNATVVKVTSSIIEGGKRVTESDPDYVVKLNGQWRWIDTDIKPSEYKNKSCGIGG